MASLEPHTSTSSSETERISDLEGRLKANSLPFRDLRTPTDIQSGLRSANKEVRTLPSWIDSFEETEDSLLNAKPTDRLLSTPAAAHPAQHHHSPAPPNRRMSQDGYVDTYDEAAHAEKRSETGFFNVHREPVRGRKWDHAREDNPVIINPHSSYSASSSWNSYIRASMYGPAWAEGGERVDEGFLEQQTPGYQRPWRGDDLREEEEPEKISGLLYSQERRKMLVKRMQNHLLLHPLVPLIFRLIVLTTSCIALGLSGSIFHLSRKYSYRQNPSTIMAIVVDVVAIPYILYFTWDEYTGKPLGLRSPKAKIRLVLLDLFFIIFESANISLAFLAMTDEDGSCQAGPSPNNGIICGRVKALSGILMIALIAWGTTFSISIFRLVERVGGREEYG